MRILSQAIKDVLAADSAETKDVVIIEIPAQTGTVTYPATTLYLANGSGVFIDGHEYLSSLRQISSIKFSLGKAPDNADIVIENVSRTLGFTLTDFQRALDGSKVTIKRAFKVADGTWEPDTTFVGYIRDVKVDQQSINISINSDMSRRGTSVANKVITQRCMWRFNQSGSGVGPFCNWQTSQPGNPYSCDKGLDTANGCQSHGNQHMFGGVPAFTALNTTSGYDPIGNGWGQGSGGGWCVTLESWVLIYKEGKRFWTKAHSLREGDYLVSVDKFGKLTRTKVVKATIGSTTTLYTVSTTKGYSLSSSPTHGIMRGAEYEEGVAVNTLEIGDEVLVYDHTLGETFKDTIASIETINRESLVLLLELKEPYHLFAAAKETNGAIISHNQKPIRTNFGDGGWPPDWM